MDWSNAAPHILEKVMLYAAQKEQQRDEKERGRSITRHTWLLTIEKFCRVNSHWKKVAFSSKKLFPFNKAINFINERPDEEAKTLLKAGFLSVVKVLHIDNPEVFKYTGNVMETSLISIHTYNGRNIDWSEENVLSMMDLISKSPSARHFSIDCQIDSVSFWQLLMKMVHCNAKPKTIDLRMADL